MVPAINVAGGFHSPGPPPRPQPPLVVQLLIVAGCFVLLWASIRFEPPAALIRAIRRPFVSLSAGPEEATSKTGSGEQRHRATHRAVNGPVRTPIVP